MNILDSLVDGALALPDRADADALIAAIVRFKRTGEEPEGLSPVAKAMWVAVRPVVAKSKSLSDNGAKGGSKSPSKAASKQPSKSSSKQPSKTGTEHSSPSSSFSPSTSTFGDVSMGDVVDGAEEEPPSLEEVRAYFEANALRGDPAEFFDHFEAQGWVRSNGQPVHNWRAQARLWARKQREFDQSKPPDLRQPEAPLPVAENRRDYEAELAELDRRIAVMTGGGGPA